MKTIIISVAVTVLSLAAWSQSRPIEGRVAFVSITTVQSNGSYPTPQSLAPHLLLRLTRRGGRNSSLVMTNEAGVASAPLEAGTYCVEVFGLDGRPVKLSAEPLDKTDSCFDAIARKTVAFSVTVAKDSKWSRDIPSLGVD